MFEFIKEKLKPKCGVAKIISNRMSKCHYKRQIMTTKATERIYFSRKLMQARNHGK
jgi:hypothetical protein